MLCEVPVGKATHVPVHKMTSSPVLRVSSLESFVSRQHLDEKPSSRLLEDEVVRGERNNTVHPSV